MDINHLVAMAMLVSGLSTLAVFCGQEWVVPFQQTPVIVSLLKARR